jgi:basic amino acid/polyamine antiporter, APA family
MIGGTVLIGVLYLLVNLVYFRAMPLSEIGASARIGEDATTALLGPTAGRLLAVAVLVSVFGCLSSAIIAASRLGLPMSEDEPAFRMAEFTLGTTHPAQGLSRSPSGRCCSSCQEATSGYFST